MIYYTVCIMYSFASLVIVDEQRLQSGRFAAMDTIQHNTMQVSLLVTNNILEQIKP